MKRYLAMAFLLILAACAGQTTDTEPQQTFSCPDGTVVTNLSDCPEPEQAPQEPETDDVVAEPEEEDSQGPGLLDAKFNREAFNEVFTSDETATPPVGSSLRDIQQRALAKTLDGYSYTYFLRDEDPANPPYQGVRVSVREDQVAYNYPEPVEFSGTKYDRIVNGLASCTQCKPTPPEPAEVDAPDIAQPLDILLRLEDASDAQSAQSINNKRTLRLDATLDGEDVTVFVDQFSGLPIEVRYATYTHEFDRVSLSARDENFQTAQP